MHKLDEQNWAQIVQKQSHFSELNTQMWELIEQDDGEGEHGSYPGTNLEWFQTHRSLLCISDCNGVVKCNF